MKAIVVYKSKTGFTKRYAEWIVEELQCDISPYENISREMIEEYDLVIYGSRIHAGNFNRNRDFDCFSHNMEDFLPRDINCPAGFRDLYELK